MIKLKRIVREIIGDLPPAIVQPHQAPNPTSTINAAMIENAHIIAATIWGEARGEGEVGMQAVLNVILNRAGKDINKAAQIALKPKQFSFWNKIANPREYAQHLANVSRAAKNRDAILYQKAIELVDKSISGQLKDITNNAKFYFNPKIVKPSWSKKMIKTTTIGNHEFYKLPAKIK